MLLLQGTETLSLRLDRHDENTKKVVEFLATITRRWPTSIIPACPTIPTTPCTRSTSPTAVRSIFTFDIKGGQKEAFEFIDHLKIFSLLANVADVKSLVIHPATTTHAQLSPEELEDAGHPTRTPSACPSAPSISTTSSPIWTRL